MPKRQTESTSSSSSSDGESSSSEGSFTLGYSGANKKSTLANGKWSRKQGRTGSAEQRKTGPVASSSTQLQRELGFIMKGESEESEVEQLIDSPPERMDRSCSSTAAAQQSNLEVKRSNPAPSKVQMVSKNRKKLPSKKVPGPSPPKKFFEGCLVLAWNKDQCYPGMIRKARTDEDSTDPDYICKRHGKIWFCVQRFVNPTDVAWRIPAGLRVFNPAQPNRFNHSNPRVLSRFQTGIRILKAAWNFSVEARLAKFTLPEGAEISDLLREIENGVHDPHRNKTSITDVVAELRKQAEFLKTKDLEKEETIKALTSDNFKLVAENTKLKKTNRDLKLRLGSKSSEKRKIESLEGKLKAKHKLNVELRANLKSSEKDKLQCVDELKNMKSEVESLRKVFNGEI